MSTIGVKKIQYPDGSDILTLDSSGSLAIGGTVTLGDDQKIKLGASGDLEIFHDTTNGNSVIHDTGAGNLRIRADDFQVTNAAASANLMFANDATGEVKLYHNGSEKLATASTGVAITGGVAIGGTGDANLLDDYEEGTFTATLEGSSSNPSSAVTLSSARYTKIGRQVMVQGQFSNVDTTGASGAPRVTGLPFAASTSFACGNVMTYVRFTIGGTASNISPYVSGSQISFYQSVSGGGWGEIAHSAGTGAYLAFTAVYDTNS